MGIPMKAKRRFVYAGHNYRTGQEFVAQSESNARFLESVGRAELVTAKSEPAAPPAAQVYQTRVMTAAPVPRETFAVPYSAPTEAAKRGRPRTKKAESK